MWELVLPQILKTHTDVMKKMDYISQNGIYQLQCKIILLQFFLPASLLYAANFKRT
jgi:hypothetical protein